MSYKYSKGIRKFDDIRAQSDSDGDTEIDFNEDYIALKTNGANRIKISGSSGLITFNEAFTFPAADGNANQILKTNGSGDLMWADQAGGSTNPGGSDTQIQYNGNNSFDGSPNLTWDQANKVLKMQGETRLIATTGVDTQSPNRNFVYRRHFSVNWTAASSGAQEIIALQCVDENNGNPDNTKWNMISYKMVIQGARNHAGPCVQHITGYVKFEDNSNRLSQGHTVVYSNGSNPTFSVVLDDANAKATFKIDPYSGAGTDFGGGIFVEFYLSRGLIGSADGSYQDFIWNITTPLS